MSRIVRCPRCEWLLREPEAATPFYQCSNCSTILQAKHANQPEPFQHEQLSGEGKSEDGLLTNSPSKIDSGLLSKVFLEGDNENSSGDDLSTSLAGKDCPSDRKNSHPKTVRTFHAFSRYRMTEDMPIDSTCSEENNQGLAETLDFSVQDISVEDWSATFNSLCSQKDGIESALSKCFRNVLAPESCHEDKKCSQSQLASLAHAEQGEKSNMQLNIMKSANEKATHEARTASDLLKQLEPTPFSLKSICREEENDRLSLEMPCIKNSVREVLQDDASQSDDSVRYSPVARVTLLNQHAKSEGKLNPTNNFTLVSSDGNRFRQKQSHSLVAQSPQRSEDLHEATSDIYDYEPSEFSSIMDESDAFDSESPFQPSEDMDLSHTSQMTMGTAAPTLRKFTEVEISTSPSLKKVDAQVCLWDHETTDFIMNQKDSYGTGNDKQGLNSNIKHLELELCVASASAQKNQQPNGSKFQRSVNIKTQNQQPNGSKFQRSVNINTQFSPQAEAIVPPSLYFPHTNAAASTHLSLKSSESTQLHPRENYIRVQHKQKLQKKLYPYLPSENQPPYILCQHCRCLLKVPHGLQTYNKISQKLRCGGCSRISVFSVQHPNFIIERSAAPGTHFAHSPMNSFKDDASDSSDDASASNLKIQKQASLSRPKAKALKLPMMSKLLHHIDSLKLSEKESNRQGEEVFPTSVGQGAENQNAEFLKTKESTVSDSIFRTDADPREPCNNSFQNIRTDSDCDSSKSAGDTSFATSSPVGMSPLQELFGYESPLKLFENESSKDRVDVMRMGFKSRMKILVRGRKKDLFKVNYERSKSPHHKVLVNGNVIPYSLVKKAEESAGPIHPGSYWYDIRAGFWGVMGGPCLGVLAPFIEEFDFPLSRDCSGGNTGVLVNGRELYQTDLEKLVQRGLPSTQGKAYKVEIDGRLIDEASGEEIRGLGRLAPSIERRGCGYGMFVPVGQ